MKTLSFDDSCGKSPYMAVSRLLIEGAPYPTYLRRLPFADTNTYYIYVDLVRTIAVLVVNATVFRQVVMITKRYYGLASQCYAGVFTVFGLNNVASKIHAVNSTSATFASTNQMQQSMTLLTI